MYGKLVLLATGILFAIIIALFHGRNIVQTSLPTRLIIPAINVSAIVEYVGLTPDGAMDIPKNAKNVAWYMLGTLPGDSGSAVIDGHYGWKDDQPAVFDRLYELKVGDKIIVEYANKKTITFIVNKKISYDEKANTAHVYFSNDGKAHLNLITCGGSWDRGSKSYSRRLVIFSDRE